jgi:ribosome-binding factor A
MQSKNRRRDGRRPHDRASGSSESRQASSERKIRQLCRQVHQRVDLVLAGELDDPILDGLWVVDVQPEPGGAALLVTVAAPDSAELGPIRASLDAARGRLRSEVAAAITRKKTPHLRFAVIPERALRDLGVSGG